MSALSRGMNQKAQVLAAIMHEPELILVDEPFSGLDPVNTRTIKQLFFEMRERGAAIVMSTHQMNQVEEMCERILLIDRGHQVLYGPLNEIRDRFADNTVEVEMRGQIDDIPGVAKVTRVDGAYRLMLEDGVAAEEVLKTLVQSPQITVNRFERVRTPLDEIFVRVVERDAGDGNGEVAEAAKT
jgi:ABC-2 type transport system ATP-binding protein